MKARSDEVGVQTTSRTAYSVSHGLHYSDGGLLFGPPFLPASIFQSRLGDIAESTFPAGAAAPTLAADSVAPNDSSLNSSGRGLPLRRPSVTVPGTRHSGVASTRLTLVSGYPPVYSHSAPPTPRYPGVDGSLPPRSAAERGRCGRPPSPRRRRRHRREWLESVPQPPPVDSVLKKQYSQCGPNMSSRSHFFTQGPQRRAATPSPLHLLSKVCFPPRLVLCIAGSLIHHQ